MWNTMIIFLLFILVLSIFEIKTMLKNNNKKDIIVYCLLAIIAITLGLYYISNPYRNSLSKNILELFGINFYER